MSARSFVRLWLGASLVACAPSGLDDPLDPVPTPPIVAPGPGVLALDLAGRALSADPGFTLVRTFDAAQPVYVALSATDAPDLAGATCDAYVVADRPAEAWSADPMLVDVRGAPRAVAFTGATRAENTVEVASAGELDGVGANGTGVAYDVVLDCDGDGALSAGDAIDGFDGAGLYVVPSLTDPGPHAVTEVTHSAGPWRQHVTYYPSDLDDLGQVPLVMVAHGFGHELTFYEHIGRHLASYGYVVSSFRNDVGQGEGNGTRTAATTLFENTEHLLANQATVADGVLDGHLDASRIVWIGHSTGGECVVHAYKRLHDGELASDWFDAGDIALVSSLAPVSFLGRAASMPYDVPYHLITGGADRDTGNYPEDGYTQNLSLFERATGNRHLTYIHGAGHGDLHAGPQNWLDSPDPLGPELIGPAGAHPVVLAYHLALVELYTRDNTAMLDFFERSDLRPSGIPASVTISTEYRPALANGDFVVDDFQSGGTDTSSSGGPVIADVPGYAEIRMSDEDGSYAWTGGQPANGMTRAGAPADDARCAVFEWAPGEEGSLELGIVEAERDLSDDRYLLFRIGQGTRHPYTVALDGPLSIGVTLRDGAGVSRTLGTAAYGVANRPYQRTGSGPGAGWANELETLRIPLADFAVDTALNLADIEAIRFEVGGAHGSAQGRVALDDVMILR
ncbi:MAG: hypothetical protein H6737_15010 [Alphaproteobacteria bacterium]|nr:hypothetical protein [Alphaproteobacteria bacterium]